jgi:hypothetical protein
MSRNIKTIFFELYLPSPIALIYNGLARLVAREPLQPVIEKEKPAATVVYELPVKGSFYRSVR